MLSAGPQGIVQHELCVLFGCSGKIAAIQFSTGMHAWTPVADSVYALYDVTFDLSNACSQMEGAAGCCDDAEAVVISTQSTVLFADGSLADVPADNYATYSPGTATATRPGSWGALKARYR